MKKILILVFGFSVIGWAQGSVLLSSRGDLAGESPAPRKLVVYPGFNEIAATNKYRDSLKRMLERVRNLHHNLDLFKQETEREVDTIVQKINSETEKDAYDSLLNDMFFEKLQKASSINP